MESCVNGSVNCSDSLQAPGNRSEFEVFGVLVTAMGGATFVLNVPTIIALCLTRAVSKALRVFLISTLLSGLLVSGTFTLSGLIGVVTVFFTTPPPPLLLCRFIFWLHNIGGVARSYSLTGFSIMVLIVVRYGKKNIKPLYIVMPLAAVWGLSLLLTIQYQVPQVYAVKYIAGAVCLPVQDETIILEARTFFSVFLLTVASWVPLVVCIAVPIYVLCYIKKNSITADNDYGKAVAKLGVFLVSGSFINATGITVISILIYVVPVDGKIVIYFIYTIELLPLFPAPILIVAFLKPVRDNLKKFVVCCLDICHFHRKTSLSPMHQ